MMRVPGDDDVVIRGGVFRDPNLLLESIEDAVELGDGAVLSVFVGTSSIQRDLDSCVLDVCLGAGIPHGKVRVSSVQRLRDEQFELVHDTSDGQHESHFHVLFPDLPTRVDVDRFIGCFDEPIPNPAKEKAQ